MSMLIFLFMLPGCGRVIDWGKSNFYQGEDVKDFTSGVAPFIRSVTIYDQLATKAIFDVLWLNDEVRTSYAHLHMLRQGKDEEKLYAFLRRQLEENNHYISFYVLSTYDVKLGVPESHWSFFLQIDDQEYHPFEVKEIELPYEYQLFFGKGWNRFKVPYIVRFHSEDEDKKPLLADDAKRIAFIARSAQKEHAFVWQLQNDEPTVKERIKTRKKRKKKIPKERVPRKRRRK